MLVTISIKGQTKTEEFDINITVEGTPKEVKKVLKNIKNNIKGKKNV